MPAGAFSSEQALTVIGIASTLTTAVFWGAYLLGKYIARLETVETVVATHAVAIGKHDARITAHQETLDRFVGGKAGR